jgi:formate hydrogenlyase subunit 6/NADH:ubiquinone oxidoreductase subunit I
MDNVQFTIDSKLVTAAKDSTILDAAASVGIRIPTLCLLKGRDPAVNCRICVVEVEGSSAFRLACATKVSEGMVIHTDSPAVRQSRKDSLELLLSHHSVDCHHCLRIGISRCDDLDPTFCEMCFFCDCVRDGFCELQDLAREYKVDALPNKIEAELYSVDTSTGCIVRNPNKCIQCRRCEDICSNIQTVHALTTVGHGTDKKVTPSQGESLAETPCVLCGRCVEVCPTGAIHELEQKDELLYHTHDYDTTTVAQVSDDVLDELAKLFKLKRSEVDIRHVVAGLKKIGVDYVVTEEVPLLQAQAIAAKYLDENAAKGKWPMVITSSYAAVQFVKRYFPSLSDGMFCYDSAQQQFGKLVRGNWLSAIKSDPRKKVVTISVTSNNDNEGEATKNGSVDYVLNARELYRIFLRTGVNLKKILPVEPDSFGAAAELTPAVARLLAPVAWEIGSRIEVLDVALGNATVKAAVGKTLGHARQLLEQVSNETSPYQIIKISS